MRQWAEGMPSGTQLIGLLVSCVLRPRRGSLESRRAVLEPV